MVEAGGGGGDAGAGGGAAAAVFFSHMISARVTGCFVRFSPRSFCAFVHWIVAS